MSTIFEVEADQRYEIDWDTSATPFGEKLYRAIEYLGFRARNCNAITACASLEKIVSERQKYRLFQKFFPDDWAKSRSSLFKTGYYENYSERINEFFQLVNDRLFPLLNGWNDDPEIELEYFYIFSLNLDLCCEDFEYENLRVSLVAALLFCLEGEEIWEFLENNYKVRRSDFPPINNLPHENLWRLEKTGKIGLYVNLFEIVDHSTDNPWLDTVSCRGGDAFGWDEQTVEFLTESFRRAKNLLDQTELVDEMIEADPKAVLLDLITLWNEGRLPVKTNKRRATREIQTRE